MEPYFTLLRSLIRNLLGPDIMTSTTGCSSYRAINDVDSTPSRNEMKQDLSHVFCWDDIKKTAQILLCFRLQQSCLHLKQVFLFGSSTFPCPHTYDIPINAHELIVWSILKNWSCNQAKANGNCSGAWTFSLLDMPWMHCTFDKVLHIAIPSLYRGGKSRCKSFVSVVKHGSTAHHQWSTTTLLFSNLIWPAACQPIFRLVHFEKSKPWLNSFFLNLSVSLDVPRISEKLTPISRQLEDWSDNLDFAVSALWQQLLLEFFDRSSSWNFLTAAPPASRLIDFPSLAGSYRFHLFNDFSIRDYFF